MIAHANIYYEASIEETIDQIPSYMFLELLDS